MPLWEAIPFHIRTGLVLAVVLTRRVRKKLLPILLASAERIVAYESKYFLLWLRLLLQPYPT